MTIRAVRVLLVAALAGAVLAIPEAPAATSESAGGVTITFFWGAGCPHCAALRPFWRIWRTDPG